MRFLVRKKDLKRVSCAFGDGVWCPYWETACGHKTLRAPTTPLCWKCPHYKQFNREMLKEDMDFWVWEEKVRKNPDAYLRGEL